VPTGVLLTLLLDLSATAALASTRPALAITCTVGRTTCTVTVSGFGSIAGATSDDMIRESSGDR